MFTLSMKLKFLRSERSIPILPGPEITARPDVPYRMGFCLEEAFHLEKLLDGLLAARQCLGLPIEVRPQRLIGSHRSNVPQELWRHRESGL